MRAKNSLYSRLDEIEGIGDKRKRVLYEKFITIDGSAGAAASAETGNAVQSEHHKAQLQAAENKRNADNGE